MTDVRFDVVGLGNAIVDVLSRAISARWRTMSSGLNSGRKWKPAVYRFRHHR